MVEAREQGEGAGQQAEKQGDALDHAGRLDRVGHEAAVAEQPADGRAADGEADLEALAKGLLEFETLSGDEIINALKGVAPKRDDAAAKRPIGPSVAVPISPRRQARRSRP